jgi:hypothetical protein
MKDLINNGFIQVRADSDPNYITTDFSLKINLLYNGIEKIVTWVEDSTNFSSINNLTGDITFVKPFVNEKTINLIADIDSGKVSKTLSVTIKASTAPDNIVLLTDTINQEILTQLTIEDIQENGSNLNYLTNKNVENDLTLPGTVTWLSNNNSIISNTGTVIRPTHGEGSETVILTATKGISVKEFYITVSEEDSFLNNQEIANTITDGYINLNDGFLSNITDEFNLIRNVNYKGIDYSIYLDLKIGESLLKAEKDEYMQAIQMMILDKAIESGELDTDLETIESNVRKARKLENTKTSTTKKKQKRKFDEAMQKYNK